MELLFHSPLDFNTVIATKFCTWHDSCAVMAYAKICCNLMAGNGITVRRSFHRIRISGQKLLVERARASWWPGKVKSQGISRLGIYLVHKKYFIACIRWTKSFITNFHMYKFATIKWAFTLVSGSGDRVDMYVQYVLFISWVTVVLIVYIEELHIYM